LALEITADICSADTLPGSAYGDAALLRRIVEGAFAKSWQLVEVEPPADDESASAGTLLPGCLDEPIVMTRDSSGALHLLSNVCTHRANTVVNQACAGRTLRCGYHGRRFRLDGSFVSMPGFKGACDFPTERDDLPKLPLERIGPLSFTNLDRGADFAPIADAMCNHVPTTLLEALPSRPTEDRVRDVAANWALYVDNQLERLHVPHVHPDLDAASHHVETFAQGSLHIEYGAEGEPVIGEHDGRPTAAYHFWWFPNVLIHAYPWGVTTNVVTPLTVDRTRLRSLSYVAHPELRGSGAIFDRVEEEDVALVEQVQRGVQSRMYERGRYAPQHEVAVHHFHRLLVESLK